MLIKVVKVVIMNTAFYLKNHSRLFLNMKQVNLCPYSTMYCLYEPYTKFILKFRNKYDII